MDGVQKMVSNNTYKDDESYLVEGKLVLNTIQKRIAAEISLKQGNLALQKNALKRQYYDCIRRLKADPLYWKRQNELAQAKKNLNFFISEIEPLYENRTLKELKADLKELDAIEKTLSITNPEHSKVMTYIAKRTAEISVLQTELSQHYDTRLQELEALSVTHSKNSSPWEGKYSHNYITDLLSVFINKKQSVTEDSLLLLEKTIELVQNNPAMAETLVQRVKDELAQQDNVSDSTQAPSEDKDETHTIREQETDEDEKRHGLK